ncbi:hypothetical protein [Acidovorax radicis]|uniref:hypothetical protein n=1 Tax=Acidovorax radicis TaxID=758826 RepID=UPI001CFB595E|nr:hypothetical protein [Acidovorax radicis]UCV00114.1 hypothetical protein KI609_04835 [Acidovorax radicis]
MTTTKTPIQIQLAQAQAAFNEAMQRLANARKAHTEGAGKVYAQLLVRHADLREKIATNEGAAEAATNEFKQLLAASNYEKTKAVQSALFTKNDALAIAEELRTALADSERTSLDIQAGASSAASAFADAHDGAYTAYARLEAFKALADCEEKLSRAMALVTHAPEASGIDKLSGDVQGYRMGFIWNSLKAAALARPEAEKKPQVAELGVLELGAFEGRKFLSPMQVRQLRAEASAAA